MLNTTEREILREYAGIVDDTVWVFVSTSNHFHVYSAKIDFIKFKMLVDSSKIQFMITDITFVNFTALENNDDILWAKVFPTKEEAFLNSWKKKQTGLRYIDSKKRISVPEAILTYYN